MKKIVAALALCTVLASPVFAAKHKLPRHPRAVHPQNPYIKHPNHRAPHHFHLFHHKHNA